MSTNLFSATPIRRKLAASKPGETYVAVTFTTPTTGSAKARPSLDIAVALDNSGSMSADTGVELPNNYTLAYRHYRVGASRLDVAKFAVERLIEQLTDQDYLTLVSFESVARLLLERAQMTESNKSRMRERLGQIQTAGSTALCDGLLTASSQLNQSSPVRRTFLFTDGQANVGPQTLDSIKDSLGVGGLSKLSVSTFGFGRDHNEQLLAGLANEGGGYYFVDNAARIPVAFGTEFGALSSTYATDVELRLDGSAFAEIVEVVNPINVRKEGKQTVVTIPALLEGQTFNVIVKVRTLKAKIQEKAAILHAQMVMNLVGGGNVRLTGETTVYADLTAVKSADTRDDAEVASALAVQLAARAQKEADEQARLGRFKEAQNTLSASASMSFSLGRSDLGNVQKGLISDYGNRTSYASVGRRVGATLSSTYTQQRATTGGQSVGGVDVDSVFGTQQQKKMAGLFAINKSATTDDDMPDVDDMVTK